MTSPAPDVDYDETPFDNEDLISEERSDGALQEEEDDGEELFGDNMEA